MILLMFGSSGLKFQS